jgi:hypothetical protein
VLAALQRVVQRYGRTLDVDMRGLQAALQGQPTAPIAQTLPMPLEAPDSGAGSLREAAATRAGALR